MRHQLVQARLSNEPSEDLADLAEACQVGHTRKTRGSDLKQQNRQKPLGQTYQHCLPRDMIPEVAHSEQHDLEDTLERKESQPKPSIKVEENDGAGGDEAQNCGIMSINIRKRM